LSGDILWLKRYDMKDKKLESYCFRLFNFLIIVIIIIKS